MLRYLIRLHLSVTLTGFCLLFPLSAWGVDFIRGDANGDGIVSSADYYRILGFLTGRFEPPDCMRSADVDDSGVVEIADLTYLSLYLSGSGPAPLPPFPNPGPDVSPQHYPHFYSGSVVRRVAARPGRCPGSASQAA